ncbi:DUF687 family protein [Candidatus Enterococcus ikei]|uniref:DUF687 family protein n=1 Tax=Candidatus Enterococcus ikei TaxID=2815326 RepID=A0ABS3GZ57_9ENTE|nr:DUF687 family protein [Enterococcus sp. DIV0869a]
MIQCKNLYISFKFQLINRCLFKLPKKYRQTKKQTTGIIDPSSKLCVCFVLSEMIPSINNGNWLTINNTMRLVTFFIMFMKRLILFIRFSFIK